MPRQRINRIELYYEVTGDGDPLVLVHGSWTDHTSWMFVVGELARTHRVLTYDRRGHSRSERPPGQGSRRTDEDDLAALIEELDHAPAHVVGNSYGGSIALGVAARRPDLVRSISVHEPPLLGVAPPRSSQEQQMRHVVATMNAIADEVRRGAVEIGVARFVEDVALGPGAWALLPPDTQRTMIANAQTFLDTLADPRWAAPPEEAALQVPLLLTDGEASPSWLPSIVGVLAATTHRHAQRHTFGDGAGHVPHLTHPGDFVDVVRWFVDTVHLAGPTQTSTPG